MASASTVAVVVPSPATSEVLRGDFLDQLRAHVFIRVVELDFLGDGDAVLGDRRGTEFLFEDDVASRWSKGGLDRAGEFLHADQESLAGGFIERELLSHCR